MDSHYIICLVLVYVFFMGLETTRLGPDSGRDCSANNGDDLWCTFINKMGLHSIGLQNFNKNGLKKCLIVKKGFPKVWYNGNFVNFQSGFIRQNDKKRF